MTSVKTVLVCACTLFLVGAVALAQQELPVPPGEQLDEFDRIIQQMKFDKPTRIVGRLQAIDGYEDAIWIVWTHVHDGRRWRDIRNDEMMFKVFPRDAGMTGLAVVAVIFAAVSAYYYLRVVMVMYMRDPGETAGTPGYNVRVVTSPATIAVLLVASIAVLILGVFPDTLVKAAQSAVLPLK